ncbi:hypothetical protein [Vibrio nereis]|uniref:hypothetical protein n=1 Tax=Vibrio nereis TaxID=693 RepID=UPI0024952C9D|nr:hypothetical protein [Vibrio nereis]
MENRKIGIIGSCLSNLTAINMCRDYSYNRVFNVAHNRSDAFVNKFVTKNWEQIPYLDMVKELDIKEEYRSQGEKILLNQYEEGLGLHELEGERPFHEHNDVDLLILDNFMDVASLLLEHKNVERKTPFFMNTNFINNSDSFAYGYFLTPSDSVSNWICIIDYLKQRFPKAKIVFLSFHHSTLVGKENHKSRAASFDRIFSDWVSGKDNIIHIPALTIKPEFTKGPEDWAHFDSSIYKSLAGLINLSFNSTMDFPACKIFNTSR